MSREDVELYSPCTLLQVYTELALCSGERIEFDSMNASYISNGKDEHTEDSFGLSSQFSYQRRVGEHIHSISNLIPVEVETKEVPEEWLHS